jgi:hypothetical protein
MVTILSHVMPYQGYCPDSVALSSGHRPDGCSCLPISVFEKEIRFLVEL